MIRIKKLPANILKKIPLLISKLEKEDEIIALYLFGSAAQESLKPLSDLDFAVLTDKNKDSLNLHLKLIGIVSEIMNTDDFDLVLLNNAPPRLAHNILKTGKLLFCKKKERLINFIEKNNIQYSDFKYYKDQFNFIFQQKMGIIS